MKRTGKVWTRIFPNIPVSKTNGGKNGKRKRFTRILCMQSKPAEYFEVDGVSEEGKEALYKASAKLPIKTKFIKR